MDIGIALPTMAPGYGPTTTVDWARGIDAGPFSSVSTGERISFDNQDWTVALAAAAAVTERVRVIANVVVLPLHPAAEVAKQAVALDQVSNGRFTLGVGVGGRDFEAPGFAQGVDLAVSGYGENPCAGPGLRGVKGRRLVPDSQHGFLGQFVGDVLGGAAFHQEGFYPWSEMLE